MIVVGACGGSPEDLSDVATASVAPPASAEGTSASTSTAGPTTTSDIVATDPATSVESAAPASTTPPTPAQLVSIDLAQPSRVLELAVIASYPQVAVSSGSAYWVTPASDGRIAVFESASSVVRFLDATTGLETARSATDVPPESVGGFLVGPDDVLYINQFGDGSGPSLVAYGRRDARYVDLGPRGPGVGDQRLVLGKTGLAAMGGMVEPLLAYVGADGLPNGATVSVNDLRDFQISDQLVGLARGALAWNVQYSSNECLTSGGGAALCVDVQFGPLDSLVLTDLATLSGSTRPTKLTLLSEAGAFSWDTDWSYVGSVGNKLLLVRDHDGTFEIGVFAVP